MTVRESTPTASGTAELAARRSLKLLWWIPLSVVVGFPVSNRFLSESWPLTRVTPLAVVLAAPVGVGAYYGLQAVRLGEATVAVWISRASSNTE